VLDCQCSNETISTCLSLLCFLLAGFETVGWDGMEFTWGWVKWIWNWVKMGKDKNEIYRSGWG